MAKKRFTEKQLARVETKIRLIRVVNRILYVCVALSFGIVITAFAVPQMREYEKQQTQLRAIQEREEETLARKEHKRIELQALREDTAYLEVHARDRLNYYREGERILRFDANR